MPMPTGGWNMPSFASATLAALAISSMVPHADGLRGLLSSVAWEPGPSILSEGRKTIKAPSCSGFTCSHTNSTNPLHQTGLQDYSEDGWDASYSPETLNKLILGAPRAFGEVKKEGFVPLLNWAPKEAGVVSHQTKQMNSWLWNITVGLANAESAVSAPGVTLPRFSACTLLFNTHYKFVFIKNTKTAGTSLYLKFGGECDEADSNKDPKWCLVNARVMQQRGYSDMGYDSWAALWDAYTIFTVARNPFDRAASSFEYILKRRTEPRKKTGNCRPPSFKQFTGRPYVLGQQDMMFNCGDIVHDLHHIEPQALCLKDYTGKSAVEYILRVEKLEADFKGLVDILNRRRAPGLKRVTADLGWEQKGPLKVKGPSEKADSSRHLAKFEKCGPSCLEFTRQYYSQDFEFFGFPTEFGEFESGGVPE